MKSVHPDIDWQAQMLAAKVLKRAMSLEAACRELDEWQDDAASNALGEPEPPEPPGPSETAQTYHRVEARSLIVTHALNTLLKRGY